MLEIFGGAGGVKAASGGEGGAVDGPAAERDGAAGDHQGGLGLGPHPLDLLDGVGIVGVGAHRGVLVGLLAARHHRRGRALLAAQVLLGNGVALDEIDLPHGVIGAYHLQQVGPVEGRRRLGEGPAVEEQLGARRLVEDLAGQRGLAAGGGVALGQVGLADRVIHREFRHIPLVGGVELQGHPEPARGLGFVAGQELVGADHAVGAGEDLGLHRRARTPPARQNTTWRYTTELAERTHPHRKRLDTQSTATRP